MADSVSYQFFLEVALKTTAILAAAWLTVFLLRRKSAGLRHLVWSAAFVAVLALPLLALVLPALRVPVGDSLRGPDFVIRTIAQTAGLQAVPGHSAAIAPPIMPTRSMPDWRLILMLVWAAGTAVSFTQMFIGWTAVERLRGRAKSVSTKLLTVEEHIELLETAPGSMPITYGLLRPAILMPADAREWPEERQRVVLLHELAHVRRGDGLTHLLARTAFGLHWWNPLTWLARRAFLKEQEQAADDLVLASGACASEYASHLLEIARSMRSSSAVVWAAVAMARPSQLEGRLLAILDSKRDRRVPPRAWAIAVVLAAMAVMTPMAALQARSSASHPENGQASVSSATAALMKQGDEAFEKHEPDRAKTIYNQVLTSLGNRPEAAPVLIRLGEVELSTKAYESATSDFERAQKADSRKSGEARMWMAIVQQRQNNLEAADALYQSALAAEDPNSAMAATILELHAELLEQLGRNDEAKAARAHAADLRNTQAVPAAPTSSAGVYRIGGAVSAPVLLAKVEPDYSEDARLAKYQGTVLLAVEIGADGVAHNIRVVRALGLGLDQKATEAVEKWKFKPATKDGQPVSVMAQIEVNFRLL